MTVADLVCLADEADTLLFPAAAGLLIPWEQGSAVAPKLSAVAAAGILNMSREALCDELRELGMDLPVAPGVA